MLFLLSNVLDFCALSTELLKLKCLFITQNKINTHLNVHIGLTDYILKFICI